MGKLPNQLLSHVKQTWCGKIIFNSVAVKINLGNEKQRQHIKPTLFPKNFFRHHHFFIPSTSTPFLQSSNTGREVRDCGNSIAFFLCHCFLLTLFSCSSIGSLSQAIGKDLFHHTLLCGLHGNVCFGTWRTSSLSDPNCCLIFLTFSSFFSFSSYSMLFLHFEMHLMEG